MEILKSHNLFFVPIHPCVPVHPVLRYSVLSNNTLLKKLEKQNFWHKIFQSRKNTRYFGVVRWNFNKSQYTVLNQAGTPVSPDNTQNKKKILRQKFVPLHNNSIFLSFTLFSLFCSWACPNFLFIHHREYHPSLSSVAVQPSVM